MEYTGKHKTLFSQICGETVNVLEYKDETKMNIPYCECTRCGKPIKKTMYVIQSKETDVELMYLGSDCIKKFS